MFTENDKRCLLEDLVNQIRDGDCLAIGGGLSSREPMAAIRALIRKGAKNLKIIGSAHGIDVDLLCGAGAVDICGESYVGFEQDFGMAPNYRRACETGQIQISDSCCYTLVQQLRAAISGLPFMPMRSIRGTGMMNLHPEYKTMTCPYTGDELVLVPAIQPDVALLHAQYADQHGNLAIQGPPVADILFAKASKKVLVTVEKIVPHDELLNHGIAIPYFYVTSLTEVAYGAHPTSCYPFYAYDRSHTADYYRAAADGAGTFLDHYLQPFVYGCANHAEYLDAVGGKPKMTRLESWQSGTKQWQSLYE